MLSHSGIICEILSCEESQPRKFYDNSISNNRLLYLAVCKIANITARL